MRLATNMPNRVARGGTEAATFGEPAEDVKSFIFSNVAAGLQVEYCQCELSAKVRPHMT